MIYSFPSSLIPTFYYCIRSRSIISSFPHNFTLTLTPTIFFFSSYTCIILDAFAYALAASEATHVISFCAISRIGVWRVSLLLGQLKGVWRVVLVYFGFS